MKRPHQVKVLNLDYTIEWCGADWAEVAEAQGHWSPANRRISIQEAAPQIMADTLLHEILHALHSAMGLLDTSTEEEFTTRTATALCTVWRDNPKLFKWWQTRLLK